MTTELFATALNYIDQNWSKMIRHVPQDSGTLIGLPCPYLVPRPVTTDNTMFQEMYYWDSFFISLGLVDTRYESHIVDIAENFAYLIERFGIIPNGSRFYFLSRSQPPFFALQAKLAIEVKTRRGDKDIGVFNERMLNLIEREHETVWLGNMQPHHRRVHRGLSRYFDINYLDILASCESGWDHSTRCDDHWLDHLPIDLNSLLYMNEQIMADFADSLGQTERAHRWRLAAETRKLTIQELMWDEKDFLFCDYNWREEKRNPQPSLAMFYPVWVGIATRDQAQQMIERWLPRFLQAGGLVTTLRHSSNKQWAAPNGWAPLQWIVSGALSRYHFTEQARIVRERWCANCIRVFEKTGAFWEKYNVIDVDASVESGVYGQLHGFGWTNGVFVDFIRQGF
jgi:alpha,alpha-trehalase